MGIIIEGLAGTISRMFKTVRKPLDGAPATTQEAGDTTMSSMVCEDNNISESNVVVYQPPLIKDDEKGAIDI